MSRSKIVIAISLLSILLFEGCGTNPSPTTIKDRVVIHKIQSGTVYYRIKPEATKVVPEPKVPSEPLTGEKVATYIINLRQALNTCNTQMRMLDALRVEMNQLNEDNNGSIQDRQ